MEKKKMMHTIDHTLLKQDATWKQICDLCIEGIENREVDDYIKQFGATWHQGYYYSKPVPIESIEKLIHKQ